jgi:hypothetical protein
MVSPHYFSLIIKHWVSTIYAITMKYKNSSKPLDLDRDLPTSAEDILAAQRRGVFAAAEAR